MPHLNRSTMKRSMLKGNAQMESRFGIGPDGRFISLLAIAIGLNGCSALLPAVPISPHSINSSGPTVDAIIDHATCEMARTLYTYRAYGEERPVADGSPLEKPQYIGPEGPAFGIGLPWKNLVDFNAVAALHLDLEVDVSRGVDPSLSYIDPISGGMNQMWTLALSGQFNGTVARHLTVDIFVDLPTLEKYPLRTVDGRLISIDPNVTDASLRNLDKKARAEVQLQPCTASSGIAGDLRIQEAFATGLSAIDKSRHYNVYDTSGPIQQGLAELSQLNQSLRDLAPRNPNATAEFKGTLSRQLSILNSLGEVTLPSTADVTEMLNATKDAVKGYSARAAVAAPTKPVEPELDALANAVNAKATEVASSVGKPKPSTGAGANTSFGTEIDFTIVSNIGVGPGLNRTHWKIGGGGGGGGAGSGSGGGASGAGGGGGGGGGNLINYNTSNIDSITLQIATTCASNPNYVPGKTPSTYWESIGKCGATTQADARGSLLNKNYESRLNSVLQRIRP